MQCEPAFGAKAKCSQLTGQSWWVINGIDLIAVAAVHDGYVLQKSVARAPLGGALLTQCMLNSVESKGLTVSPPFSFRRKEKAPGQVEVGPDCHSIAAQPSCS